MADREIVYRLRADTSSLEQASGRAEAALAAVEKTLGDLAGQLGSTAAASGNFERSQDSATAALKRTAQWERSLAEIRNAGQSQQRAQYQSQQQFLQGLEQQANGIGKTRSELLAMEAAQRGLTAQAQPFIARLAQAEKGIGATGAATKLTRQELLSLKYTASDVVASLGSGASPMTILLQQGGQVVQSFGSVGQMFSKLGTLLTPVRLAVGGVAAAVGTLAYAALQGHNESVKLNDSLLVTNNYAGQSAGSIDQLAHSIAELNARPIGSVREALQGLVATGAFGPGAIEPAARAIVNLQRVTGQSTEDIVKDFSTMSRGVAAWAAEHNRQYNYLTAAEYRHIRALEAQGRVQEAVAFNSQALADKFAGQTRNLGFLESAYESTAKAVSKFWDALKNLGRDQTPEDRVASLTASLKEAEAALNRPRGTASKEARQGRVDALRENLAAAQSDARQLQKLSEGQAAANAKTQDEILKEGAGYQSALLNKDKASYALRQAVADDAREHWRAATLQQFNEFLISGEAFRDENYRFDLEAIESKRQIVNQEIALETKRKAGTPEEQLSKDAKLIELRTRLIGVNAELFKREEEHRNFKDPAPERVRIESPQAAFRQGELAQQAAIEQQYYAQQHAAQLAAARDLVETNRAMGIELIQDDRARGQAQIALEEERLRKTLDLASLNAEDRKKVEDDLATWRVRREALLNEQLKPEFQRNLDAWKDQTRLMREIYEEFQNDLQRSSEDIWVNFVKTGKLNLQSLADIAITELARLEFRQNIAPLIKQAGDYVGGLIGIKNPATAANDATGAAGVAASFSNLRVAGIDPTAEALGRLAQAAYGASSSLGASGTSAIGSGGADLGTTGAFARADRAASAGAELSNGADQLSTSLVDARTNAEKFALFLPVAGNAIARLGGASSQASAALLQIIQLVLSSMSTSGAGGIGSWFGSLFSGGGGTVTTGTGLEGLSAEAIGSFWAKGGAFGREGVHAFAQGAAFTNSIVSQPTLFKFAKGSKFGAMGEAGDEAVMPLQRGPGGVLGVANFAKQQAAAPASAPVVNVQVNTLPGQTADVKQKRNNQGGVDLIVQMKEIAREAVREDLGGGHGLTNDFAKRFGLNAAAGAPTRGRA